jgi:hypothetical protein
MDIRGAFQISQSAALFTFQECQRDNFASLVLSLQFLSHLDCV